MGLMQLKFETAREVARDLGMELASEDDLFRPETNLVLGLGYLTRMIAKFRSFKLGLLAYNQGPGVIEGNLTGNTELSIRYYNKVLRSYFLLKRMVEEAK
jgi:soluble lytic murein transglycosylase-like protein